MTIKPCDYLTEEQKAKISAWFSDKYSGKICHLCSTAKWYVSPHVITPIPIDIKHCKLVLGGEIPVAPQIMIVCNTCGNTKYLSVMKDGKYIWDDLVGDEEYKKDKKHDI